MLDTQSLSQASPFFLESFINATAWCYVPFLNTKDDVMASVECVFCVSFHPYVLAFAGSQTCVVNCELRLWVHKSE